jgi:hypothetical protein
VNNKAQSCTPVAVACTSGKPSVEACRDDGGWQPGAPKGAAGSVVAVETWGEPFATGDDGVAEQAVSRMRSSEHPISPKLSG